jgi:diguanylate cyclase (GGDEF)-like protein
MFSSFSRTRRNIAATGSVLGLLSAGWAWRLGAVANVAVKNNLPHGYHDGWEPQLAMLHDTTDVLIALSFLFIAATLAAFYRRERRRAPVTVVLAAFSLFLAASGLGYAMDVLIRVWPMYWLVGDLKLMTALGAVTTAIVLPDVLPRTHKLIQDALSSRRNEGRFLAASDSSRDAFFILESVRNAAREIIDFRFVFVNHPGARLLGTTQRQLTGQLLCESYPINRTGGFFERYKTVVETGESLQDEFAIDAKGVDASWLSQQVVKLEDGVAITTTDISAFKANEQRLTHLAQHDALTGLASRRLFEERLCTALNQAAEQHDRPQPSAVGLLVVDCDNFKRINDLLGHQAGDALLIEFADRLKTCVRGEATVARVGGDEFMVVLGDLRDAEEAMEIAQSLLTALQQPMSLDAHPIRLEASIGVCVYPDHMECGAPGAALGQSGPTGSACAAALLKNADAAMYRAKAEGRNRVQGFTQEMARSLARRRLLDAALQQAMAGDEFELWYQPRVDLRTGLVTGVEALLRWRSEQLGIVMPGEFIPIAEENGLIVPLGRWVLEQACREMDALMITIGHRMALAVNVSPRQFQQAELASEVADSLQRHGLDPALLELEITESLLLQESPTSRANIEGMRALGVSLAIDDFGTGYSSMSYLTRLQVGRLKIDQS